jgi:hypothetical protein
VALHGLEDNGFTVLEAHTADYAVTLLASWTDIGVVFTDINPRSPCTRCRSRPAYCGETV